MTDLVVLSPAEAEKVHEIAAKTRDEIVERVIEGLGEDRGAYGVAWVLALLAASAFIDDPVAQADVAVMMNQTFAKNPHAASFKVIRET